MRFANDCFLFLFTFYTATQLFQIQVCKFIDRVSLCSFQVHVFITLKKSSSKKYLLKGNHCYFYHLFACVTASFTEADFTQLAPVWTEIKAKMAGGKQSFNRPSDRNTKRQTSKKTAKPAGRHKGRALGGAK